MSKSVFNAQPYSRPVSGTPLRLSQLSLRAIYMRHAYRESPASSAVGGTIGCFERKYRTHSKDSLAHRVVHRRDGSDYPVLSHFLMMSE